MASLKSWKSDWNQAWLIVIIWEPSYMFMQSKVIYQGQKVIWGQVIRQAENVKVASFKKLVRLEPNLVYWHNMGTFICLWGQRSYTKVKGHLRSSCKMGWKCENGLLWKVEVWFEPNLLYWCNMGTCICSCSQRSQSKVKGHLRSMCNITWEFKFWLICIQNVNFWLTGPRFRPISRESHLILAR